MRALSLHQPWASAMAVHAKMVETRSWSTKYRGMVAIHAAKRKQLSELIFYSCCWNWCGALRPFGLQMGGKKNLDELLPFGCVIAVGELVECRPTDSFTQGELDKPRRPLNETSDGYDWTERQMGDYRLDRYGWVFANIWPLSEPLPLRGLQGLWSLPTDIEAEVVRRIV